MQLNVKTLRSYFFLRFFLRSSLAGSLEPFYNYNLIFLYFQFSAVRPDHLSQAYLQKTLLKIRRPTDHPIRVQIRPTNPNTITDNQTRPPISDDHWIRLPRPQQTTTLDYSASYQHITPNLLRWYRSGTFLMGWVKGGISSSG